MALVSPHGIPERMLIFGNPGSGKTYGAISIAKTLMQMGSPAKFHVLDSDMGAWGLMTNSDVGLGPHLNLFQAMVWEDYTAGLKSIIKVAKAGDWVVVDRIDEAWKEVAGYYIRKVYKKDPDEWFLEWQVQSGGKGKGNPLIDAYQTGINPLYFAWEKALLRLPCNIIVVAGAAEVISEGRMADRDETKNLFWGGVKAQGQRGMPHRYHTILFTNQKRGEWQVTTVRERDQARRWMDHEKVVDLGKQYLVATAGWRVSANAA